MRSRIGITLTVTIVLGTVAALGLMSRAPAPRETMWEDVQAEAVSGGYRLLSTEALWEMVRTHGGDLLLVDTRQPWEYRTGHIEGALNFPIEPTWWSRWRSKSRLEAFLGTNKDRPVVFY